ncbi:ABC transporter ATP-binding protein [Natrialbaceae archaeon A-arb3/5]
MTDVTDAVITATDICKSFDDEDAVLDGVDLTVRDGETLVLMGPNGAGKSVLLSCLAGGDRPDSGRVDILGSPATDRDDTTSFLLQDALAHEKLTGRENIAFYERLHPNFTEWSEYVDRLDLDGDALAKTVEDYSGGMVRKLELAIAASIDAPIYLFDEPTAALDLTAIGTVHELFREKRDAGKTLVVASHRPMDADVADRIAFLADGRIVETGTPEDLLASVPPVLETGVTNATALAEAVAGEPYAVAGSVRGFLPRARERSGSDFVAVIARETGIDPADLSTVEPTYTDLFNYYTNGTSTTSANSEPDGPAVDTATTTTACGTDAR